MASATLAISVSADDLAKLRNLPVQVGDVVSRTKQLLDGVRGGSQPGNALSGLLGNLSGLAGGAPDLAGLLGPIEDLLAKLPAGTLADLEEVGRAIEEVLNFFGPLRKVLLSGRVEDSFRDAVEKALDQAGRLFDANDEVRSALTGLEEFARLFSAMIGWEKGAPQPREAADLFSRAILGIPHDLLADVGTRLGALLAPLGAVLPDGPDLGRWRGAPAARKTFWEGVRARFDGGQTVDWPRLEADLRAESQALLDLAAARDRLLAVTLGNLNALRLDGLDALVAAIRAVPRPNPQKLEDLIGSVRDHLGGIVDTLETWAPTPDELRATVRAYVDRISDAAAASPLGQVRAVLLDAQHRLLLAIESLPFRALARREEDSLREVARKLDVLDPDRLRKPVHDFFQSIEDRLHEFPADAVKDAIQGVWDGVKDALDQIRKVLEGARDTIQGAIAGLKDMVERAQPELQKVSQSVAEIKASLDAFDLSQPASLVIDDLKKLRGTVASLDLSSLPAPAVGALHAGADALREINLSAEINPPLNDVLAKIDPTPIIERAAASLSTVTADLKLLDPAAIAQALDAPIDDLIKAIGDFGPEALQKLLHEALRPVEDAIRGLDFAKLFAPLTRLFADLSARVNAVLDPDAIFRPIEEAFRPVVDLIDRLEPNALVRLLEPHTDALTGKVGGAAAPSAPLTGTTVVLKAALQPAVQAEDDLFGFRPGDMLVPVIDLHHSIVKAFDRLDDAVLEPAARLLRDGLHGPLQALDPAALEARIDETLLAVGAEFDPAAVGGRLLDAEGAYHEATSAIAVAASGSLSVGDAAVAARVAVLLPAVDPLNLALSGPDASGIPGASAQFRAGLDFSELRSAFATLGDLESLLPATLTAAEPTADAIRQVLRALDPAPARVEINALFDQLGRKVVGLQDALVAAIDEGLGAFQEFLVPVTPGGILRLASQLHSALKDQLLTLGPTAIKEDVRPIFDAVKKPLSLFDPSTIIADLNGLRDELLKTLEGLVAGLLPDPAPFQTLVADLAGFRPSAILAPITEALRPLSELVATLDVKVLLQPLLDAMARIRGEIPDVVARIEASLDDVLAAFPDGGSSDVSVNASASIG